MVIRIRDIVDACDTEADGEAVLAVLRPALASGDERLTISFDGISGATSSFVNVAFVELLDAYSFDDLRSRLHIVASNRQINEMIKNRLSFERNRTGTAA